MADRALSETAMQAGLRDIHLPVEAAGGALAEILAAAGLGIGLALVAGMALRLVTTMHVRDESARSIDTLTRVEALHVLKARRPERFAEIRPLLYRPGARPSLAEVQRDLAPDD